MGLTNGAKWSTSYVLLHRWFDKKCRRINQIASASEPPTSASEWKTRSMWRGTKRLTSMKIHTFDLSTSYNWTPFYSIPPPSRPPSPHMRTADCRHICNALFLFVVMDVVLEVGSKSRTSKRGLWSTTPLKGCWRCTWKDIRTMRFVTYASFSSIVMGAISASGFLPTSAL